jgi:hypothetical protein
MENVFTIPIHVTGTLGANVVFYWTSPFDCTLLHVSAVASNASSATIIVGESDDTDEYLTSQNVGDSAVPAEFDGDDFVDTDGNAHTRYYPRVDDGTIVVVTVDYDGASGTAAANLSVVLTLAKG